MKTRLQDFISKNDFDAFFKELKVLLAANPKLKEVIFQEGRFSSLKSSINHGVISEELQRLEENKIRLALLELLDEIENSSFESAKMLQNENENNVDDSIFKPQKNQIAIKDISIDCDCRGAVASRYIQVDCELSVGILNNSSKKVNDFEIELYIPKEINYSKEPNRTESGFNIFNYEIDQVLYENQSKNFKLDKLEVNYFSYDNLLNNELKIRVYSESRLVEKSFELGGKIRIGRSVLEKNNFSSEYTEPF